MSRLTLDAEAIAVLGRRFGIEVRHDDGRLMVAVDGGWQVALHAADVAGVIDGPGLSIDVRGVRLDAQGVMVDFAVRGAGS